MRASAENDLVEDDYPEHVVGSWIGHTPKVQQKHYLRVLDSYFDKATQDPEKHGENFVTRVEKAVTRNDPQNGVKMCKNM